MGASRVGVIPYSRRIYLDVKRLDVESQSLVNAQAEILDVKSLDG
jgi:hypothetical protein